MTEKIISTVMAFSAVLTVVGVCHWLRLSIWPGLAVMYVIQAWRRGL